MSEAVAQILEGEHFDQDDFNLKRWEEVLEDRFLASLPYRIETNRFGQIVMTPPPAPEHGSQQFEIGFLLRQRMGAEGRVITECPISTSGGVRACDTAWISRERFESQRDLVCLVEAPQICVEVLSPSNSPLEIEEKRRLYFEAGASEVWICAPGGGMTFFVGPETCAERSVLCPEFPTQVDIPA